MNDPRSSLPPQLDARHSPSTGMPRWVKLFILAGVILLVLLGAARLLGGEHGPGRHFPSSTVSEPLSPPPSSTP